MIFDEVITGFRLSLQGAQGYFGVQPDLTTFGKIIGAGMPVGAYGGRKEIMQLVSPVGKVYQAGTLSGNPVAMAAGLTQLTLLRDTPDFYKKLNENGDWFYTEMDKILTDHPETEFVQLQLNYLDWDNETVQSRKCYEVAKKHGKDIIVMEPVKGGTLAKVPEQAEQLLKRYAPAHSVPSWAIRFAASLDNVVMVLSGMSSMEQLQDNMSYMEQFQPMKPEEIDLCMQVRDIINGTIAVPCTACRYCVEGCPMQIPIPDYFALYNAELQEVEKPFTVQQTYYENLTRQYGKASDCVACRQCEQHCPQHISIVENLKKVAETFEV